MLIATVVSSCSVRPRGLFDSRLVPQAPDYSDPMAWAALPERFDSADLLPPGDLVDAQAEAEVDVFFLYPTTYTGKRGHKYWNADVRDAALNLRTDKTAIKYQASIFNAAGRIYAPRYRQAHLEAFYTKKSEAEAMKALDLAYQDVKASFQYYLKEKNNGRPIIIASHSQGTVHAARILLDFFDGKPLQDKLVAAYLVGMPLRNDYFQNIPVCQNATETECFCTWRTMKEGYRPKRYPSGDSIAVTNPLSWSTDGGFVSREQNLGALVSKFHKGITPEFTGARVNEGLLWVPKPKIPGVPMFLIRNYHIGDFNFFYINVRENAKERVAAFFKRERD